MREVTVVRGEAADWPAASWTFASLAARLGDARVPVHTGRWRRRGWRVSREGSSHKVRAATYLTALEQGAAEGYLAGTAPFRVDPTLRADLRFPEVGPFSVDVAWIGPAGISTPLHRDQAPNRYAQLVGQKRWRIWAPDRTLKPVFSGIGFQMAADPPDGPPDLDVVLHPGDLLLLPAGWWHQVDTLTPAIAVNRWWRFERLGRWLASGPFSSATSRSRAAGW